MQELAAVLETGISALEVVMNANLLSDNADIKLSRLRQKFGRSGRGLTNWIIISREMRAGGVCMVNLIARLG